MVNTLPTSSNCHYNCDRTGDNIPPGDFVKASPWTFPHGVRCPTSLPEKLTLQL